MTINILPGEPEAFSLFGEPLYRLPLRPEVFEQQEKLYVEALKNWEADPEDPNNIIWLGRRTAYLGRYREAIAIFTHGIEKHPKDPKFPRHRGHRFITIRHFERAVEDFEKAEELMLKKPDEIEPDGLPNPRDIPVSTLYFNVYYHLALGHYLLGDFEKALDAYLKCLKVSDIDDKYVATAHWTYMTRRILGDKAEAEKLLPRVTPEMDIIENHHYHSCLLMYKGEKTPEKLIEEACVEGALGLVTTGYGVANWYNYNGEKDKAVEILREIVALEGWAGFGYLAAEADLKRLGVSP
ncbi:MAG: tetratricopeptide repeat protein [Candidatus Bathyarchaeota archaeon]|nr:tetratricopeptide repeat protein [Candidatus Bathyarchaeota archaeon]